MRFYTKIFILITLILTLTGCNHCNYHDTHAPTSHSCPKAGHGPCYLCDDPNNIAKK